MLCFGIFGSSVVGGMLWCWIFCLRIRKGVLVPIYVRGASVLFLPQYSSDLNLVELMWSKLKAVLRKLGARIYEELHCSPTGLVAITQTDIQGWFKHDGYRTM